MTSILERATAVVMDSEESYIYFLFDWKKQLEESQCKCPNCQKERSKVDRMIEKESRRLQKRREANGD